MDDRGAGALVRAFSGDLFTRVAASGVGNVVCSPYSVAAVLAMVAAGANGPTLDELLRALPADDAGELASGLGALGHTLAARSWSEETQALELTAANSLWGQIGFGWEAAFLGLLKDEFGAALREIDYAEPEKARLIINAWASRQTRGRIPEVIPPGLLDPEARLALVNAVYFKGPWRKPFRPARTHDREFHRLDGSVGTVPMMSGDIGNRYAEGPGWTAVDLPYAHDELAMAVVVPDTGRYAEVERSLAGDGLDRVLRALRPGVVDVVLPRWTARASIDLKPLLQDLGVRAVFEPDADLGRMTREDRLMIAAALQQTFVSVDEAGTEAAAVTVALAVRASGVARSLTVVADRPFLYIIHDRLTGTPLFVGRVLDPAEG